MCEAAAHHHRIGFAGELEVIGIASRAAHQDGVLGTGHRLTDAELHQRETVWVVVHVHLIKSARLGMETSHGLPEEWITG